MTRWAAIHYRDFLDQPRIFSLVDGGRTYLFDCAFDAEIEDYPDDYRVYLMPALDEATLAGSWADLSERAMAELGTVRVENMKFDPTMRQFVDASILDRFQSVSTGTTG